MKRILGLFLIGSLVSAAVYADTVTLITGRKMQGIVTSADEDPEVVLEVGSGTVVLTREEVLKIERAEETVKESMREEWAQKRIEEEAEFQRGLAQERLREENSARLEKLTPKKTNLIARNGYLFVNASVNGMPPQEFMLDTGAPTVVLTHALGLRLGLLNGKGQEGELRIVGRALPVRVVQIPRIELDGFWATDVQGLVHLEEPSSDDDILGVNIMGMSFLEHFHFQINVKRAQLTLSWEEF